MNYRQPSQPPTGWNLAIRILVTVFALTLYVILWCVCTVFQMVNRAGVKLIHLCLHGRRY